jgi:hypothetical protein
VRAAYGRDFVDPLEPALRTDYRRMTFAGRDGGERLTCDFDLFVGAGDAYSGRLRPDFVILETKSPGGATLVDRTLKALGVRPVNCSKYCVGTALARPHVKDNDFRRLLRRYFESLDAALSIHPSSAV